MSIKFDKAIPYILKHEGGLCNVSGDPGGLTNFGICQRQYPSLDIANLTEDAAIRIYESDYWMSYMDLMPDIVAAKLFDMSVNMGHDRANKLLQQAVGVDADGQVGAITLAAVKLPDPKTVVQRMCEEQSSFYIRLAERKPEMKKFLAGWLKRASWVPTV